MELKLHKNARTTPAIRDKLKNAPAHIPNKELATKYGLHYNTA